MFIKSFKIRLLCLVFIKMMCNNVCDIKSLLCLRRFTAAKIYIIYRERKVQLIY